jgi:hypothetical protein
MSKYPGPTWTSPHVYGDTNCNDQKKLFYINIPKCASMWMRKYISLVGQTCNTAWVSANFTTDNLENYTPIILLRDPVKRWASNCPAVEIIIEISQNTQQLDNIFRNFDDWTKDEHSSPQYDFIAGLDLDRAVFFYCDDNLSKNVEHYFKLQGFDVATPTPINERPKEYDEQSHAWEKILNTPKYFEIFKQHFQKDYDLINSVNFYNHYN